MAAKFDTSKHEQALDALLDGIKQAAEIGNGESANHMAEAFAWLFSPHQSHAGGVKSKS